MNEPAPVLHFTSHALGTASPATPKKTGAEIRLLRVPRRNVNVSEATELGVG